MPEGVELLEELEERGAVDEDKLGVEDELEEDGVLEDERALEEFCAPGIARKKLTTKTKTTATAAAPTYLVFKRECHFSCSI